jgi:hypothetical protein
MAYGTYLRFTHTCNIYKRVIEVNDAGQKLASFKVQRLAMPCEFQNISSERRIAPYIDNVDEFQVIIPHIYNEDLSYQARIEDITDRYGSIIESGPFEIVQLARRTGFNGKVHHIVASVRLVVENG